MYNEDFSGCVPGNYTPMIPRADISDASMTSTEDITFSVSGSNVFNGYVEKGHADETDAVDHNRPAGKLYVVPILRIAGKNAQNHLIEKVIPHSQPAVESFALFHEKL